MKQSLTHDEPIFIKRNGKVEIISIGDFVDSILNAKEEIKDVSFSDIEAPAFDPETNKYSMQKVSHVIRHKRENEILRIKTEYNKEVKITGCHSLFAYNQETRKIESIEARSLKIGDYIVVPKNLPEVGNLSEINLLDYVCYEDISKNWMYVYGIKDVVEKLRFNARIIHKKLTTRSRKYYQVKFNGTSVDILEESMRQYIEKGFLPINLVYKLKLINEVAHGSIITYKHGKTSRIPVTLGLDRAFMRFLGLYIAEGHSDTRQLGLTFGKHEDALIDEVMQFAKIFGLGFSLEPRDRSIRVKLFNNIFVKLIRNICGAGAHNKKIPEFIFRTNKNLRQHFIDGYCQGDGHKVKQRNCLMFTTVSKSLAFGLQYLFLMNGVTSTYNSRLFNGLGKKTSLVYRICVYGDALNASHIYSRSDVKIRPRIIDNNVTKVLGVLQQEMVFGDLGFVKIKEIEIINTGYEYVYDLSVPRCENFVGGTGGISCHNSRGQQGIGISAAVMYSQLTTGKPIKITSKIGPKEPAHYYELHIDTARNEPEILKETTVKWDKDHGTKIEIQLEGKYQKGKQSVDEYLKQTAVANPHVSITFVPPDKQKQFFKRVTDAPPKEALEIKPHPYGIELGMLISMLKFTKARTVQSFLSSDFSRISSNNAKEICKIANVYDGSKPNNIPTKDAESLFKAMKQVKIMAPPTNVLSPIGEDLIIKGLKKEVNAEFYVAVSRSPAVYRGNPFQIEVGIAYGGELPQDDLVRVYRFANRVPLLFQQSACASNKSILDTAWRNYGISQSRGALPSAPMVLMVHIASVWVPFTSESKEAIAHYPDIIKELKLSLQDAGRKLSSHIRKTVRARDQKEKAQLFEKYIPELANALFNLSGNAKANIEKDLMKILKKQLPLIMGVQNDEQKETTEKSEG
ncbi:MAG: DNA topoisomerase VI subunit B [Candidatus Nanoarchaeia archaeon]|nr:DNA topoisomerase VI subunit B [Candidatus Nanoarchaeia archaeon]